MGLLLPVDPPEAQRLIQRSGIGYRRRGGILFGNPQPNPIRLSMIRGQPLTKLRRRAKEKNFPFANRFHLVNHPALV
jgi:hypothetical protein